MWVMFVLSSHVSPGPGPTPPEACRHRHGVTVRAHNARGAPHARTAFTKVMGLQAGVTEPRTTPYPAETSCATVLGSPSRTPRRRATAGAGMELQASVVAGARRGQALDTDHGAPGARSRPSEPACACPPPSLMPLPLMPQALQPRPAHTS